MSFTGGYQSSQLGQSISGSVFITDIEAIDANDQLSGKVYSSDGKVLDECLISGTRLKVFVLAITGKTHFKPTVWIEGNPVELSQDEDQNIWTGWLEVDVLNKEQLSVIHEDGASHSCILNKVVIPIIELAEFTGKYPENQSELKQGDSFGLRVSGNTHFSAIEVYDYGAAQAEIFQFEETLIKSVAIAIADRGSSPQELGVRLRIIDSKGIKSDWYLTEQYGSENGRHILSLNNLAPSISVEAVLYPEGQGALKGEEMAILKHSIQNFDSVSYNSPNYELAIREQEAYHPYKQLNRIGGTYNVETTNLSVCAKRTANAAETTLKLVIRIANAKASLSLLPPESSFQSGGNYGTESQTHFLDIQLNQHLVAPPRISLGSGQLKGEAVLINQESNIYRQEIMIHDLDPKGVFEVNLIEAKNLSAQLVESINGNREYEVSGFVKRRIQIEAFTSVISIGTEVSEIQNLEVKDQSERLLQYSHDKSDALLSYTILDEKGEINPKGKLFHWNDEQAVLNNTTGLATISIKEEPKVINQ